MERTISGEPVISAAEKSAAALRHFALDEKMKAVVMAAPHLYHPLLKAARRYIGGETLAECTEAARRENAAGNAVTIDYMGESTRDAAMAAQACKEFVRVAEAIADYGLRASVSLDLSHIGLVIDEEMAFANASRIALAAREANTEVMISAEGFDRTDAVLRVKQRLNEAGFDNVGITLQVYLHRTPDDLETALAQPGRIRLVKGAFEMPEGAAHSRGMLLDQAYQRYMTQLVRSGHACSLATHDPALLNMAQSLFKECEGSHSAEFEMLYGVTPERLQTVQGAGFPTRVYLPYGSEWYLYLCNRLAEYPPNLYQALADAVS